MGEVIHGHPVISVPNPHPDAEHTGLVLFTSSSIVPVLRFYSFTFRVLIIASLALVILARPLYKIVRIYGWNAPTFFRNQTGLATFHPIFRSNQDRLDDIYQSVVESICKLY